MSGLTSEQVLTLQNGFWGAHMRCGITENTLTKWACALSFCTPPCTPVEKFNGSQTESSAQHGEASYHTDLRPMQQADLWQFIEKLEVHLLRYEHHGGDIISLSSGITGELPQCRGSRPAAPTADGWQKPHCFQK